MLEKSNEMKKRTINDILWETFLLIKFCGLWQPFNLNYPILKIIYIFYSIFTISTMISVGLSLICFIFISSERIKDAIIENSFLLFTLLNGWVKAFIFLSRHRGIKSLLKTLLEDHCQPQDITELEMQKKFDEEAKKVTFIYITIVIVGVISYYFSILISDERVQALNTWRPYDINLKLHFWITWIHELIGHIVTSSVHVAVDSLVPGFIIQTCCQLHFLQHRLNRFPLKVENIQMTSNSIKFKQKFESTFISKSVIHHNTIFRFAENIKNLFVEILLAQFVSSLIAICVTMYKISKEPLNFGNMIAFFTFLICMLTQLFFHCFYGNELMFSSSDLPEAIFETNWLLLGRETRKSLLIMMIRCKKPILISIGSIVFVNLNSFASILKASYSAFNVLQHSI
ncbi:odorant receptor 33a-like [Leptopilina boulardi]|uniref:odorant receptor 33a-like n=1 Tax=Leptopilina boulardi TaxID=63433 RepID=UPI0021F526D6|nr:odorant receptor 33a-like [Leptopilina boulardi]